MKPKKKVTPKCGLPLCNKNVGVHSAAKAMKVCGHHWDIVRTIEIYLNQLAAIQSAEAEAKAREAEYTAPAGVQLELPEGVK
jgi:hypothetical protein